MAQAEQIRLRAVLIQIEGNWPPPGCKMPISARVTITPVTDRRNLGHLADIAILFHSKLGVILLTRESSAS